jgi:manganese/zinc/iron transport system ATP- binding protein
VKHDLVIEDLTVSYNRIPAVHHVNLHLSSGSCIGLLGPNGAGKTTLLKALAGLLPFETGRIRLLGAALNDGRVITYVPQREAVDWDFPITVRGLAEMGR